MHSFQTNPNSILLTALNFSLYLQLYQLHLLNAFVYFDFVGVRDTVQHSIGLFIDFVAIFRRILMIFMMRGDD